MCIIDVRQMPLVKDEIKKTEQRIKALTGANVKLKVLDDIVTISSDEATVINVICKFFEIDYADIIKKSRKQNYVDARSTYAFIMRHHYKKTYSQIASLFKQDHTTVIHSIQRIEGYIKVGDGFSDKIDTIIKQLKNETEVN